ncbi:MAG: SDR family oxidoreductase [Chloroflexi bacterium]|nr:SDR family oxidoreductase [Chloroflexota bacterium]
MELKDKVAIVTGGTGGLGRRICRALALEGAHIAVVYLSSHDAARQWAAELTAMGPHCAAIQADVTEPAAVTKMVEDVVKEFGRVDILVNNAAFNQWVPFKDLNGMTLELWNKILHYNVTNPFLCIKAVAPVMKAQGQGRIVNISSVAGHYPSGSSIAYAVSKSALNHLTRCMAVALAPEIIVNSVGPGLMQGTRMTENLAPEYREQSVRTVVLKRTVDKDDVADQVVAFCRTDSTTGQNIVIDAGRFFH